MTLAILTDDDETWRPEHYSHERWGCRVVFEFPIAKLTDWHAERARLEVSRNPIALIILAHDITRVTKHEPLGRATAKFGLIRRLFALGYKRQDVLDLLRILDWIVALPPELNAEVWQQAIALESEGQVTFVSPFERFTLEKGIKQGREEGREEGLAEGIRLTITRLLSRRFGSISETTSARIKMLSLSQLEQLADAVIDMPTLEALDVWLANLPPNV